MKGRNRTAPGRLSTPIFVFDDYVDYLKAWYAYAKRFRMTQKEFVARAGVGSQAYFSDILARRKKLARQHITPFANALELSGESLDFFTDLVLKDHVKTAPEKESLLRKLATMRSRNISGLLTNATVEYFSSWKYPVIREYIVSKGTVTSLREIKQAFLYFSMSLDEIRRTVAKLALWKMVVVAERDGTICPAPHPATSTYSGMPYAVVNDVKRLFIESSVQAMEALPPNKRHISMAIKGIRGDRFSEFCCKIEELRREFLQEPDEVNGVVEYVYGFNVQLFPLMRVDDNGEVIEPHVAGKVTE